MEYKRKVLIFFYVTNKTKDENNLINFSNTELYN